MNRRLGRPLGAVASKGPQELRIVHLNPNNDPWAVDGRSPDDRSAGETFGPPCCFAEETLVDKVTAPMNFVALIGPQDP